MKEFRKIKSLKFLYEIDKYGNIRNIKSKKYLKHFIRYGGYDVVNIRMNNKPTSRFIHRLIYEAWVGDIPDGMVINHKDFNKLNNDISNLECITQEQNVQYSYFNDPSAREKIDKVRINNIEKQKKKVLAIELNIEKNSLIEMAQYIKNLYKLESEDKTIMKHISQVCLNKRKTAYKNTFKFI